MADITMCKEECTKSETCYRAQAKASNRQSYFYNKKTKNEECEHYWKMEDTEGVSDV